MKKIIFLLSIIIIILVLIIIFMIFSKYYDINFKITKKENNITNNEKYQNSQIEYDNELKIKTLSIKCENETTNIKAQVTNNTGKTYHNEEIKIVLYLTTGEIKTLPGYFGENFKTGTTREINSSTDGNLCNYYKIEYIQ